MARSPRSLQRLSIVVLLLGATSASAQDWPQWRGPNRDGKATGFKAPATWPENLTKKWDIPVGNGVANPSLAGDRLYLITREGSEEVVRCLNAATGEEIWKDHYEQGAATGYGRGPNGMFEGARATPTVANGRVVTLGVCGMLKCYDAATGKELWKNEEFVNQVPGFFTSSSPLVIDGMCIAQVGASGGEGSARGATAGGAMIAYDLATGNEKWRAPEGKPAYGSPVAMTVGGMKVIVTISETELIAVNAADGKVVWQLPYKQGRYNAMTPIVDGDTLIIAGPNSGITAMKLTKDGDKLKEQELWKNGDNSLIFNTPVLKDGALYGLNTQDRLFAVNAEHATGWVSPIVPPPAAAVGQFNPSAAQGVFAIVQEQQARGGEARGQGEGGRGEARGQNPGGQRRGQRRGGGRPAGGGERPGYGSVVDAGSVLVALCPAAQLVVFKPDAGTYSEIARYKVSEDGEAYSHPILSGNRIYIKDKDSVSMWVVE